MAPLSQAAPNLRSGATSSEVRPSGAPRLLTDPLVYELSLLDDRQFALPNDPECRLVAINERGSAASERFSTLASRLKYAQQRHSLRKLLVTSAVPGDGKTMVSTNLAVTLALHRQRTLLIDGDLRKPSVAGVLKINSDSGLADWWKRRVPVSSLLFREENIPLWVLPAGRHAEDATTLLQSAEFAELLTQLSLQFDWVVIDSSPLVPFGDAATMATMADAIVLVTRRGATPTRLLRTAVKTIDSKKIIATVLNDTTVTDYKYYQYYDRKPHHSVMKPEITALRNPANQTDK